MADFPTSDELRELTEQKGRKALVVYALRGALRKVQWLGRYKLEEIWPKKTFLYVNHVFRVYPLIYLWLRGEADNDKLYAAYAADADVAINDLNQLKSLDNPLSLLTQDLWWHNKSTEVEKDQPQLITNLKNLNLDFLAKDLTSWLNGKWEPATCRKYSKNISADEINSAEDLQQLIEGEIETKQNFAVRALLLGPGGAGKTSLAELIEHGKTEKGIDATIGLNYQNFAPINLNKHAHLIGQDINHSELQLNLWDFGGQAIFHSMHRAFMRENCVYILVVDSRHEQAPEPWLHQISKVIGHGTRMIVVTNWFDEIKMQQNREGLIRQFDFLTAESFYDFSCIEPTEKDSEFGQFIQYLAKSCYDSIREVREDTAVGFEVIKQIYADSSFTDVDELEAAIRQRLTVLVPTRSDIST